MRVVLHRTVYGRSVTAIGQNPRAADRAGIRVERIRFFTYVMCAVLRRRSAAISSRGFSGGSALYMGEQYLLASIAVVVIGGTSVAGGNGNVPGLWGAALFLFLLQSMLNTYQLSRRTALSRHRPHHHRRDHRGGRPEAVALSRPEPYPSARMRGVLRIVGAVLGRPPRPRAGPASAP